MQQDSDAEKSYREALRRDPRLVNSYIGLAKVYQREAKYQQAFIRDRFRSQARFRPHRYSLHEGTNLLHLGRKEEGKKELEASVRIDNQRRAEREKQVETAPYLRRSFCRMSNKKLNGEAQHYSRTSYRI